MADLDPAHVEAVAEALSVKGLAYYRHGWGGMTQAGEAYVKRAKRLLTSTDPDVHAALLAALVRAGVLSVEFTTNLRVSSKRYVTRWEDVDVD